MISERLKKYIEKSFNQMEKELEDEEQFKSRITDNINETKRRMEERRKRRRRYSK